MKVTRFKVIQCWFCFFRGFYSQWHEIWSITPALSTQVLCSHEGYYFLVWMSDDWQEAESSARQRWYSVKQLSQWKQVFEWCCWMLGKTKDKKIYSWSQSHNPRWITLYLSADELLCLPVCLCVRPLSLSRLPTSHWPGLLCVLWADHKKRWVFSLPALASLFPLFYRLRGLIQHSASCQNQRRSNFSLRAECRVSE